MILLDTNVLSELMRTHPSPNVLRWLDAQADTDLHISVVSKAEIELGVSLLPNGKRKLGLSAAADTLLAELRERCVALPCAATPFYARVAEASRSLRTRTLRVLVARIYDRCDDQVAPNVQGGDGVIEEAVHHQV